MKLFKLNSDPVDATDARLKECRSVCEQHLSLADATIADREQQLQPVTEAIRAVDQRRARLVQRIDAERGKVDVIREKLEAYEVRRQEEHAALGQAAAAGNERAEKAATEQLSRLDTERTAQNHAKLVIDQQLEVLERQLLAEDVEKARVQTLHKQISTQRNEAVLRRAEIEWDMALNELCVAGIELQRSAREATGNPPAWLHLLQARYYSIERSMVWMALEPSPDGGPRMAVLSQRSLSSAGAALLQARAA